MASDPVNYFERHTDNNLTICQVAREQTGEVYKAVLDEFIGRFTIDKSNPDDQVVKIESLHPLYTNKNELTASFVEIHYLPKEVSSSTGEEGPKSGTFAIGHNVSKYDNGMDQPPTETKTVYSTMPGNGLEAPEDHSSSNLPVRWFSDLSDPEGIGPIKTIPAWYTFSDGLLIDMFWGNAEAHLAPISPTYPF